MHNDLHRLVIDTEKQVLGGYNGNLFRVVGGEVLGAHAARR